MRILTWTCVTAVIAANRDADPRCRLDGNWTDSTNRTRIEIFQPPAFNYLSWRSSKYHGAFSEGRSYSPRPVVAAHLANNNHSAYLYILTFIIVISTTLTAYTRCLGPTRPKVVCGITRVGC